MDPGNVDRGNWTLVLGLVLKHCSLNPNCELLCKSQRLKLKKKTKRIRKPRGTTFYEVRGYYDSNNNL